MGGERREKFGAGGSQFEKVYGEFDQQEGISEDQSGKGGGKLVMCPLHWGGKYIPAWKRTEISRAGGISRKTLQNLTKGISESKK